jgi:arginase
VDQAPRVYRELGLVERLAARDLGDLTAPPYHQLERPPGRMRHQAAVGAFNRRLAERVAAAVAAGDFLVLLGGDCSILWGALAGLPEPRGLAYVDGHGDFALPSFSPTGSPAAMALALAVGREDRPPLPPPVPPALVREEHAVVLGRRDHAEEAFYGGPALRSSGVGDVDAAAIAARGPAAAAREALERVAGPGLAGFWIHLDADVLAPRYMPAVDSPDPGGLAPDPLVELLAPLVRHPRALGLQLTIYDPGLDPDRSCGRLLVEILERSLGPAVPSSEH